MKTLKFVTILFLIQTVFAQYNMCDDQLRIAKIVYDRCIEACKTTGGFSCPIVCQKDYKKQKDEAEQKWCQAPKQQSTQQIAPQVTKQDTSQVASTWTCSNGHAGNTGKFCSECGNPAHNVTSKGDTIKAEAKAIEELKPIAVSEIDTAKAELKAVLEQKPVAVSKQSNIWNGTANTTWYKTKQSEFIITTAEQLAGFAKLVNNGTDFAGKTIKLGANILINNTENWENWENSPPANVWTPIGTGHMFYGIFDGDGYVISGIYINSADHSQGLFAQFSATMKNLGVIDSYIKGVRNIGGLAGFAVGGKIINSYFTGIVTGQQKIGGLVGTIRSGTIINSHFMGTVTGQQKIGGLIGDNWNEKIEGVYGWNRNWNDESVVSNSYYNMQTSNFNFGDDGKTMAEMEQIISLAHMQVYANKESINEINALIKKRGIEANVILDKCSEHQKLFAETLQPCLYFQDSIKYQPKIDRIKTLLKTNKLKESLEECKERYGDDDMEYCVDQCNVHRNKKLIDLCEKQLVAKIKKLPKNKINSIELANIYYGCENNDKCQKIVGWVFQNNGEMALVEDINFGYTIMVQYAGYIGNCRLMPTRTVPFGGYAKYLGMKTYTTVYGARQSVPNYQLLWCD
ncbi:MAG: hypothetical protein FWC26_01360 [Fibromonadales bacterium]|nr:hypothetical protein [Fibromonadales bacterium]